MSTDEIRHAEVNDPNDFRVPAKLPDDVEIPPELTHLLDDAQRLSRGRARDWWGLCADWLSLRCAQDAFKAAQGGWVSTSHNNVEAMNRATAINHLLADLIGQEMHRTADFEAGFRDYLDRYRANGYRPI